MHLVYITAARMDYIGESELAAGQIMSDVIDGKLIKLENVTIARQIVDPQGRTGINQSALISNKLFGNDLMINPKYIIDVRVIPKGSPLRKSYDHETETARARNSGIVITNKMPATQEISLN